MSEINDRYYFMLEISKYLGISRDSALKWIANKVMSAHKVWENGSLKFPKLMNGYVKDKPKKYRIYLSDFGRQKYA